MSQIEMFTEAQAPTVMPAEPARSWDEQVAVCREDATEIWFEWLSHSYSFTEQLETLAAHEQRGSRTYDIVAAFAFSDAALVVGSGALAAAVIDSLVTEYLDHEDRRERNRWEIRLREIQATCAEAEQYIRRWCKDTTPVPEGAW
jgi:hypothetical protein